MFCFVFSSISPLFGICVRGFVRGRFFQGAVQSRPGAARQGQGYFHTNPPESWLNIVEKIFFKAPAAPPPSSSSLNSLGLWGSLLKNKGGHRVRVGGPELRNLGGSHPDCNSGPLEAPPLRWGRVLNLARDPRLPFWLPSWRPFGAVVRWAAVLDPIHGHESYISMSLNTFVHYDNVSSWQKDLFLRMGSWTQATFSCEIQYSFQ